ncbi:MAG: ATP-binding protein [Porphyromonas sp.]|nr:ATP-binding protein [Porphyromonas sp.]
MELTNDIKGCIVGAMLADRANYPSDARQAKVLGISASVYNNIKKGNYEKQLSEPMWVGLARRLGVELNPNRSWKIAKTATYQYISTQLELCQRGAVGKIICDLPNVGKTFTALAYVKTHPRAIYIDCSQVKTKMAFIRQIAKEFGITCNGRYADVYEDLALYLQVIERPLIILDEAGDLHYEAFLEIKALYNRTKGNCGWCMLGADGLRAKIERNIGCRKVGYTEIFSRFGDGFSRATPEDEKERERFLRSQVAAVAKVNAPEGADVSGIIRRAGTSLRRLEHEFTKLEGGAYGGE